MKYYLIQNISSPGEGPEVDAAVVLVVFRRLPNLLFIYICSLIR